MLFAVVMNITLDKIKRNIEEVIRKFLVLFGIKHFEQRRCRVTFEIGADFVNFIEQEDRIVCAGILD